MPDASAHPQPCVQKIKARKQVTTGSPNGPAFPARWFYGLFLALPGERALLSPSPARCESIVANLMPASRHQDHTASSSAACAFVFHAVASIASRTQRP